MENRIVVTICDQEYTLVAEESASYMQKVGSYVSEKMGGILTAARVGCGCRSSRPWPRRDRPRTRSAS